MESYKLFEPIVGDKLEDINILHISTLTDKFEIKISNVQNPADTDGIFQKLILLMMDFKYSKCEDLDEAIELYLMENMENATIYVSSDPSTEGFPEYIDIEYFDEEFQISFTYEV